jgi:hypothetical protein
MSTGRIVWSPEHSRMQGYAVGEVEPSCEAWRAPLHPADPTAAVDASYLADTVIVLRLFEHEGRVKKAISVLKKRSGPHEETIRQLWFDTDGVHLSAPLVGLRGVLAGVPVESGLQAVSEVLTSQDQSAPTPQ